MHTPHMDRLAILDAITNQNPRDETPVTVPRWALAEVFGRASVEDYAPDVRGEIEAMDVIGDALGVPPLPAREDR